MEERNEYVQINGARQSLMTLRTDPGSPVLLIVHGGAGCPDRPLVRAYSGELADRYTVVCWDQRGCGFSAAGGPLTVARLLADLSAVVDHLRNEYGQERIFLAGHSWGSYLALRFAAERPGTVRYYIGTGQEISAIRSEIDKYRFCVEIAHERGDRRALRRLEAFGEPRGRAYRNHNARASWFVGKTVFRYAGYFSKNGPPMRKYLAEYMKLYVKCYGRAVPKLAAGAIRSLMTLNAEMDRVDNISGITELPVPVLLISGKEDMVCPVATAQRWFDALTAPKKEFVKIENASHMVNFEQPQAWNRLVLGLLTAENRDADPEEPALRDVSVS